MDPGVENIVDIGLVNYVKHPTNPNFMVFRFVDKKRAEAFEQALKANNIWFEKAEEQGRTRYYYLFGIRNRDYKKVQAINFDVEGKNRSFIIKNNFLRWSLVVFFFGLTTFAIVGYIQRPDVIQRKYIEQKFEDSLKRTQP
jgi:hypothetical protein